MDCMNVLNYLLGRFRLIAISTLGLSTFAHANNHEVDLGSWLDQAAMACEQKDKTALNQIQHDLQRFFQKYPQLEKEKNYVESLLKAFHLGDCNIIEEYSTKNRSLEAYIANKKQTSELRMAVSHVTNVNLGSRHESILVNNPFGEGEIELLLNDESLPKSDIITELALSHWYHLSSDWDAQVLIYHQNYQQHNEFDLTAFNATFSKAFRQQESADVAPAYGQYQFGVQGVWLDNVFWQQRAEFAVSRQLAKSERALWSAKIKFSYQHYPERNQYDALDSRLRVNYQHKLSPQQRLHIEGELGYDAALNERAGGDRPYLGFGIGFKQELGNRWLLTTSAKIRLRNDQAAYNQAFFAEQKRQQRLTWLNIKLDKQINKYYDIGLSYSRSQHDDAGIALFDAAENQRIMLDVNYHW
jgi:hypothetical protein